MVDAHTHSRCNIRSVGVTCVCRSSIANAGPIACCFAALGAWCALLMQSWTISCKRISTRVPSACPGAAKLRNSLRARRPVVRPHVASYLVRAQTPPRDRSPCCQRNIAARNSAHVKAPAPKQ